MTVILIAAGLVLIACLFVPVKLVRRISLTIITLAVVLAVFFYAFILLASFLGYPGTWLSLAIGLYLLAVAIFQIWKIPSRSARRKIRLYAGGAILLASVILAAPKLYRLSLDTVSDRTLSLKKYEPFLEGTLAASLEAPSLLTLKDDLPRLDGATALYPVYSAFARAVYPQGDYPVYGQLPGMGAPPEHTSEVICQSTRGAFENLLEGLADVVFLAGVSADQSEAAKEKGLKLKLIPVGREAFVFFVNKANPVSNLTVAQIKDIYSGKITDWGEAGGGQGPITAYQRAKNSGSQSALLRLMGDTPLMRAPEEERFDLMSGIVDAVAQYRNYKGALGYSFRFFLTSMSDSSKIKLLSINGVAPSVQTIGDGSYPLAEEFFAVMLEDPGEEGLRSEKDEGSEEAEEAEAAFLASGAAQGAAPQAYETQRTLQAQEAVEAEGALEARKAKESDEDRAASKRRRENALRLIEWILGPQGQSLVEKTGYVPVK
ncbi:MAG: substrate-binding domain-containing protein [Deltaproteobacteria bacterium]|jgi:phosphate transport system substrate-binding protein|nr:substrate-binding domain-containing protein [Deltaproteobacteria bacterium]